MSAQPQKRPTRKREKPAAPVNDADLSLNDAQALTRTLLGAWAWHPSSAKLIHDTATTQTLPVDFDSTASYQRLFQPCILDEALAALQKQFQDEVTASSSKSERHVYNVQLKRAAQVSEHRTDVECVLRIREPDLANAAIRKLKQEHAIVLLCSVPPPPRSSLDSFCQGNTRAGSLKHPRSNNYAAPNGRESNMSEPNKRPRVDVHAPHRRPTPPPLQPPHPPQPAGERKPTPPTTPPPSPPAAAPQASRPSPLDKTRALLSAPAPPKPQIGPPIVIAGCVKHATHANDAILLEMQTGFEPLQCQAQSAAHPAPTVLKDLLASFEPGEGKSEEGGAGERGPRWTLVCLSPLVTQQREMAALEAMMREPLLQTLARPRQSLLLSGGAELHKVWPAEAVSQPYFEKLKAQYDATQLEAIEVCATLVAHPDQVNANLSGKAPLPVVLIQGPPGTGKTHTIKGILNTWHIVLFQRRYASLNQTLEAKLAQVRGEAPNALMPTEPALGRSPLAQESVERVARPRILVCAPSNGATDELLDRLLKDSFVDLNGNRYNPSVIRIGSEAAAMDAKEVSPEAQHVWVEQMIKDMFEKTPDQVRAMLRARDAELHQYTTTFALIWHKLKQDLLDSERLREMTALVQCAEDQRRAQGHVNRWRAVNEFINLRSRTYWDAAEIVELSFMEEAEIVFTTLSSTGRRLFSKMTRRFDLVLIDEAAQGCEIASLQPLVLGSGRVVLVGDPEQLPATVLSKAAKARNYDRSLFERLRAAGWPVKMLSVQYRMHRSIRSFPSKHFYDSKLKDGANVIDRPHMPYYDHNLLKPYVIFDVAAGRDQGDGSGSRYNLAEINMALALFQELHGFLLKKHEEALKNGTLGPPPCLVGILAPYRKQVDKMREAFRAVLGPEMASHVRIDTVDSFQGKQMDVIILSCVRGSTMHPDRPSNSKDKQALLGALPA